MPSQSGNPPNGNPQWSDLSSQQIAQRAFQETTDTYRVDIAGVGPSAPFPVEIISVDPSVVFPVVTAGLSILGSFNIPFSSISTVTPFVITAGLASVTKQVLVADTTGGTMKIMFASSFFFTNPGAEREYDIAIPPATSITIQSQEVSNPVAGNFIVTFLG